MSVWSAWDLQWADIDEKPGLVYIRRSLTSDGGLCSIREPKGPRAPYAGGDTVSLRVAE